MPDIFGCPTPIDYEALSSDAVSRRTACYFLFLVLTTKQLPGMSWDFSPTGAAERNPVGEKLGFPAPWVYSSIGEWTTALRRLERDAQYKGSWPEGAVETFSFFLEELLMPPPA